MNPGILLFMIGVIAFEACTIFRCDKLDQRLTTIEQRLEHKEAK